MPRLSAAKKAQQNISLPGKLTDKQIKDIDVAVGAQVRTRRVLLGLTQEKVSSTMGLTFQQLQKYEHGTNRISASRLYQLGTILRVPVSYFFEGVDGEPEAVPSTDLPDPQAGVAKTRKAAELVRSFYAIPDQARRDSIFQLIRNLAVTE